MTGEKNRYSTVEKLWKLDDTTLKTPKHDEMVIYLLHEDNIKSVIPLVKDFFEEENDIYVEERAIRENITSRYIVGSPSITVSSEVPITANNGFLVGYFDIVVTLGCNKRLHPIYGPLIGDANKVYPKNIYIEVKPTIDSFGATLRQLRTYQEYVPDAVGKTYLFTSDLRFKDAFESQGIKVISPP